MSHQLWSTKGSINWAFVSCGSSVNGKTSPAREAGIAAGGDRRPAAECRSGRYFRLLLIRLFSNLMRSADSP